MSDGREGGVGRVGGDRGMGMHGYVGMRWGVHVGVRMVGGVVGGGVGVRRGLQDREGGGAGRVGLERRRAGRHHQRVQRRHALARRALGGRHGRVVRVVGGRGGVGGVRGGLRLGAAQGGVDGPTWRQITTSHHTHTRLRPGRAPPRARPRLGRPGRER